MTCIVGFVDNNKNITLGGDSAGVAGLNITIRNDPKVFKKDNMVFGYTSSFRMGQLLRFKLRVPKHRVEEKSDYEYMCTDFIDSIRKCLKDNGYTNVNNNEETIGVFIVGYRGSLYTIESDLQVAMDRDPYVSCGCGVYYALGSLNTSDDKKPKNKVLKALETAEKFSGGVRRPFNIVTLTNEEK